MSALDSLHHWLFGGRESALAEPDVPPTDVDTIRREMIRAVEPCSAAHRAKACTKVLGAAGALDLWMLRSEIYLYLAQDLGQGEATVRINSLMPMFRHWVPPAHEHRYHP